MRNVPIYPPDFQLGVFYFSPFYFLLSLARGNLGEGGSLLLSIR